MLNLAFAYKLIDISSYSVNINNEFKEIFYATLEVLDKNVVITVLYL